MDDARWDLTKKLFADALALPHGERAAFLDRECAGDAILRFEVESLLEARTVSLAKLGVQTGGGARAALAELTTGEQHPISEVAGTIIGPYKLLQPIGEGGFGTVFMAEQERPVRRRVALKIIKMGMDTKQVIARFEQERQALALMDHPHIAKVLDAGATETGRPFFVMELVKGEEITRYCDRNQLGIRERFDLFQQVCAAVQHAHTKGIIHRDIKPSNVLVSTQDGQPFAKVIDFGIAKATDHRLTEKTLFTDHHAMIGTPAYMSPEQAEGSLDIDTRTDVYSLGVLLYELLVGSTPFDSARLRSAAYAEMQRLIREVEPPSPSGRLSEMTAQAKSDSRKPDPDSKASSIQLIASQRKTDPAALLRTIRGELDWMVMKALDKDRARRYETPSGLADDIRRYLTGQPVLAAPPSRAYAFKKFVRRHRVEVLAGAAVAIAIILGLLGTITQAQLASRKAADEAAARQIADQRTAEAEESRRLADARSSEIEHNAYVANVQMAAAAMDFRQFDRVRQRLNSCPEHLRGWEWKWLNASADNSLLKISGYFLALSPDGSRIVTASDANTADVWDTTTGELVVKLTGHGVGYASFSPDGSCIVTLSRDKTARVLDATTGATLFELSGHTASVTSARYSPDGSRIVTASDDNTARVWDAKTGRPLVELTGHTGSIKSAEFNNGGSRILTSSEDYTARVWDAGTGLYVVELKSDTAGIDSAAFFPDGSRILTSESDGTASVWDATTGQLLVELKGHTAPIESAAMSSDGSKVATASWDKSVRVWSASTGKTLTKLTGHSEQATSVKFSPDGTRIVTTSKDKTARLWDVVTGRTIAECRGHTLGVYIATFAPDGSRIITGSWDKIARVWDAGIRRPLDQLGGIQGEIHCISCNHDGSRIVTGSIDGTSRVWDAATGACLAELGAVDGPPVRSAAFSQNGTRIVTTSGENAVRVWETSTGNLLAELNSSTLDIRSAAFSPDGTRIVTACGDNSARVWDARTGQCLAELAGHTGIVYAAAYNPDGTRIVTASADRTARLWNAHTGQSIAELKGHTGSVLWSLFSPSGARIVTGSQDNTARVWDTRTGQCLAELKGHTDVVLGIAFSPDGSRISTASGDNTARIWNANTGEFLAELKGHAAPVFSVAFSPDGTRAVTGSWDMSARIWDPNTGESLGELKGGHSGGIRCAIFSPDGTRIITTPDDEGAARVWDSVAYRDRFPAIDTARKAETRIKRLVRSRVAKGEKIDEIRSIAAKDITVTDVERIAYLTTTLEEKENSYADATVLESRSINAALWELVKSPLPDMTPLPDARPQTARLLELAPDEPHIVNTVGVTFYRLGQYEQAIEALTKSDTLYVKHAGIQQPSNWAFIAMSHWQLGHQAEARAAAAKFRSLAADDHWKESAEVQGWIKEVDAMITPE